MPVVSALLLRCSPLTLQISGAEGTIIEDADLPRMIWGLDLDDTNLNVNPARNASAPAAKIQPSRSDIGAQYISSKPALRCQLSDTLSNYPHSYGPPDRKAQEYTPLALKTPAPANYAIDSRLQGQNSRASYSRIPHRAWNEAPIQLPGPLTQAIYEKTRCGNSGVDWSDLPSQRSRNPSGLKSSAPTFVPSHQVATPVVDTQSCIFVEPRAEAQITPERRLSAIEIAQRYRVEQQQQMQAALPTPPNSSWPIWSPTFSTYAPSPVPPQGRTFHHPQQPSPPHQYYTSGPIPVSGRDFSEELRQIEAAKRELGAIIGLQGVAVSDNNVNATSRTTNPPGVRRQDGLHRPSPAPIDMSLILKHHSNVSRSDTSNFLMPRPNVPVSTPQPRHPLGQRPQTIPMTHLVQRRLSSVREEDAPFSSQTDSPLVHVSAGMSFSQNTDLGANEVHESRRMSRSDGKVAAGRLHVRVEGLGTKQDDDKENKTGSGKETNTAKPTPKKKWRPRKKSATAN
ncbi:hypothetical protein DXG03_003219 [Asterophora parasitica]|uniref:Uncharacterized protein n=1 Tax=Asterophora parasitica TaxID=117018 RepID=A0A9P7GEJ6_9AGAR|nr:hypothetical protein DXG03_003219 [Asterophora parasitica]